MHLPAHESKALAQFEQEPRDVVQQALLQLALGRILAQRQEVEVVGVLDDLPRQVRLRRRQRGPEVGDGLPSAGIQVRLDPMDEHAAGPAVRDGLLGVPGSLGLFLKHLDQHRAMEPRERSHRFRWLRLSRRLRDNWSFRRSAG
jgi:hypothetical protein